MRMATVIAPLLLLLVDSRLVQALVHRSVKHGTATGIGQVLLLLHDLPRALRYKRLLLNLARRPAILQPLVHLLLPAAIVVREGHIQVGQIALAVCLFLVVGSCLDLLRLEGSVTEGIVLRLLWLRVHLLIRTQLLAVRLAVKLALRLPIERGVLVAERGNLATCRLVHLAAHTCVVGACRDQQVVHLVGVVVGWLQAGHVIVDQLLHVSLGDVLTSDARRHSFDLAQLILLLHLLSLQLLNLDLLDILTDLLGKQVP